jgi:NTP pyrophosphatase (non-canonical NTP hydrolase)
MSYYVTDTYLKERERQDLVVRQVLTERERQDRKWGEQNHDPLFWLAILQEEVGETAKAILEARFARNGQYSEYREEMIQVAAVAIAAIECLDREAVVKDEEQKRHNL